jgi:hypothetical protein
LPSIGQSVEIQEPQNIYFFQSAPGTLTDKSDPPEKLMVAWNETKEMPEMSELASYGNYSVLIAALAYQTHDRLPSTCDYFVIVSTLQPDNEGLVHQLIVRFKRNYDEVINGSVIIAWIWSITHIETYIEKQNFNPVTVEEGEHILQEFGGGWFGKVCSTYIKYPFLILLGQWFVDTGSHVSVIMNLLTGKILVVNEVGDGGVIERRVLSHNLYVNPTSNVLDVNFRTIARTLPEVYNARPGDALWFLYFDVNRDDIIDIYDAMIFAKNR